METTNKNANSCGFNVGIGFMTKSLEILTSVNSQRAMKRKPIDTTGR